METHEALKNNMSVNQAFPPLNILVIRRDNIGDLICTTPLLHALRDHLPQAKISVLVSSYNVDLLHGNPDIDDVFVFLKRRHKNHGYGFLSMLWRRWQLERTLRKRDFDYILLANGGSRYARRLGGKKTVGFRERNQPDSRQPDIIVPLKENGIHEHEVSKLARLGATLGVPYEKALGPTHLFPKITFVEQERERLIAEGWNSHRRTIGLHISSRYPQQRWSEASFVALAAHLIEQYSVDLLLFWSPGAENNPMHPGDDEKAARIMHQLRGKRIFASPTTDIPSLVAAVSLVDQMICSDGGALHVAAALKKPLLSFFLPGNIKTWHPWNVPYVALSSREVANITLEEALAGFVKLQQQLPSETSLLVNKAALC